MDKGLNIQNTSEEWRKDYRELEPIKLWGANVDVDEVESFKKSLVQVAQETNKNQFGYFLYPQDGKTQYHISRYPRRKYGPIPDDTEVAEQLGVILKTSKQKGGEEMMTACPRFRIVLGLEQGYGTGTFHTIEEVISIIGNRFQITPAKIFSVKADGSTYQEPAIRIEGDIDNIREVYALAEKLHQERFAVNDFSTMTSHIVETKFCSSPDME